MMGHILVVEDDPLWLGVVERRLTKAGYTVESARNGQVALQWLADTPALPALVLTDLLMPEADGLDLCAGVRSNSHTAHLPIIIMSAIDGVDLRARAAEFGVFRYLTKPVPAVELLLTVDAAMASVS